MNGSASRSRLYELRRDHLAAQRGADLLQKKKDVLLRETARRANAVAQLRADVTREYREAKRLLRIAEVEIGREGVGSAALAQPMICHLTVRESSVMGVHLVEIAASSAPYRAIYGAASTSASLDAAGSAWTALLSRLVELASEERAVSRLRMAVRKTTKIVNALQKVILPRLAAQILLTVDSIAEEERDEAVRRKMRHARTRRLTQMRDAHDPAASGAH